MIASAERVRNGRIACRITVRDRPLRLNRRGRRPRRLVPRAERDRQTDRVPAECLDPPEIRIVERVVIAHRRGRRAQQEAQVPPVDRHVLELQHRRCGQPAVQIVRLERNRGQRHPRLDAPLELQQLDLQVRRRCEIGLFLLEPPELGNLARFRSRGGGTWDSATAGF